ncbi:REP element-mobilizing transposase RayT [Spirosomataceae bacterium TFI 002]|nr:REP element-mobilizing transposase RayT [Spirosomataceae bacterium TFI 002]
MGQTLVKNYLHIVFSTKNREKLIDDHIEDELFAYLGGLCNSLDCIPIQVGGYRDHVHILCSLSKKVTLVKLLEIVKSNSSKWIKTKGSKYKNFYWQNGYGSFSVNPKDLSKVANYIANQRQHHEKSTFQEEYMAILGKYKIVFDEKYIWD